MERLMKAVNVLILLAVLAVLAGGGWLFWRLAYGGPALDRGIRAMKLKKYTEAVEYFKQAVKDQQEAETRGQERKTEPFVWLGRSAAEIKDWNLAATGWKEALERDETLTEARIELADLYRQSGQNRDAEKEYETLLKQDPKFARAHFGLGKMAAFDDRFDRAIEHYEKARDADPDLLEAGTDLAVLYNFRDRDDEGAALCDAMIARHEDHAPAWSLRGDFHNKKQEFDQARKCGNNAIGYDHTLPEARITLGVACFGEKLLDAAIPQFEKALELRAEHPGPHYFLGLIYVIQGKYAEAKKHITEAKRITREAKKSRTILYNPGLLSEIEKLERELEKRSKSKKTGR